MFYRQYNTSYETHTRVIAGIDCIGHLGDEIRGQKASKILLVSDPHISETSFYKKCLNHVKESGVEFLTYNDVEEEAPLRIVEIVRSVILENKCDLLIAVGGGSVIDTCKGAGVLATNGGLAKNWAGYEKYSIPPVPLFTIPTTAGTSSEVTSMAIIHDEDTHVKFTIGHKELGCAKVAFLDSGSLSSCPRSVIALSGIDALSHAFESFIALKANPITEALSLQSIRLISRNLRLVHGNSDNAAAALDLLIGSTMAGLAFTTTGCGNAHCIGRHVGPKFNVNHGMSIALVLPAVARFNFNVQMEKYRCIAEAMDLDVRNVPLASIGVIVADAIQQLINDVGIKQTMQDMNPSKADFEEIAKDGLAAYKAHYNMKNPSKMSIGDFMHILEDC